jgi:ABC-type siderophore export system fused ATPase/permease subunit
MAGTGALLKLLSGLLQPTQGEILINGEPIRRVGLAN